MSVRPYHSLSGAPPQEGKRKEETLQPEGKRNSSDLQGRVKVEQKSGDERARPLLADYVNPVASRPGAQAQTRILKGREHVMPVVQQGNTPRPDQPKISLIPAAPQPNRVRVNGGHNETPVNPQGAQRQPVEARPSRVPVGKPNQRRAD